jgi:integrase
MNHSSFADMQAVERFLQTQRLRDRDTRRIYGYILRAFQRFASSHSAGTPLSVPILQQWLQERHQQWPLHMVCHRARLVERFLEWLQAHQVICTNPFADLHRRYGPRTTPIVRALVSDISEAKLEELRPQPRFGSFLGEFMVEHVTLMRSLGYRYNTNEGMLLRFDRFLQNHSELAGESLNKLIDAWSESHPSPNHLWEAQRVGRLISKAMHRLDPTVPILPIHADAPRGAYPQQRRPYLYSDEEIQRILKAALSFPSPKAPLRPLSLYTMVVLAYCAGLRLGEIVALTLGDVDLHDDTIEIRETKFFKSRRLPLASSVMEALKRYLVARQQAGAPINPVSGLFWNQQRGERYSYGGTGILLVQVLRRAGLKPAHGRVGPRIHDLRHAMAGHRMRNWYKQGINPQSKLPYLATYLGHKDIQSTLVYLNITPELLHEASERFRKNGAETLRAAGELP